MLAKKLATGVYEISLGMVNVWLVESDQGLVLIDTGIPGSADKILGAVREIGKQPTDLKYILLTHTHPDHIGSLAALQRETHAPAYAHPIDAPYARTGGDFNPKDPKRYFHPTPRLIPGLLFRLLVKPYAGIEAGTVEHEITEKDSLDFLPDLKILFTPGHSMGHISFLLEREGGVLFAGDVCADLPFLDWSLGYEDFEVGKRTLKELCQYDFQIVTFGHGKAITKDASQKWRKRWSKV